MPFFVSSYQVSLSESAEETLEKITTGKINGDVVYYWSPMDVDKTSDFWSMCDSLNAGNCRCCLSAGVFLSILLLLSSLNYVFRE
jgi:hypothetical protein